VNVYVITEAYGIECLKCGGWTRIYKSYLLDCSAINAVTYFGNGSGLRLSLSLLAAEPI
jgi:hypothetical protein